MDLPPSHRHLKEIYYFKALVDAVLRTPPVFLRYCNSCLHLPGEGLQVRVSSFERGLQEAVSFKARFFEVS